MDPKNRGTEARGGGGGRGRTDYQNIRKNGYRAVILEQRQSRKLDAMNWFRVTDIYYNIPRFLLCRLE